MRHIDHIIIHAAATPPDADIGALDIDKWHRARGWFGNGYHYVIRRDGTIETEALGNRCRPLSKAGAHVGDCGTGWNKRSIGICMAGGIDKKGKSEDNFTDAQYQSLKEQLDVLRIQFPDAKIMGHRDLIKQTNASPKDCPCFEVSEWLEANGF